MLVIIGDLEVNLPVFTVDLFYIKHAEYNWKKPLLLKKKTNEKHSHTWQMLTWAIIVMVTIRSCVVSHETAIHHSSNYSSSNICYLF